MRAALRVEAPEAQAEAPGPCVQANVDRDLVLLDAALAHDGPARALRIWTNGPCVVISKRLAAQAPTAAVARALRSTGVQLAVRASGGSAVVHRAGVLNISLAQVAPPSPSMAGAYDDLTALLARALRRLGLETCTGPAPGAYCDGAHNLLWRGRKLAGTAAVIRRRDGRTARLAHASLVVSGDLRRDLRLVEIAERHWPAPRAYLPDAHTSVREALGSQATARRSHRQSAAETR